MSAIMERLIRSLVYLIDAPITFIVLTVFGGGRMALYCTVRGFAQIWRVR